MGGLLSCISCQKKYGSDELASDNKVIKPFKTPSSTTGNVKNTDAKYSYGTNTGLEIYQILRNYRSKSSYGLIPDDDGQLSNEEKIARAVVFLNLFVTSQVICPAIERYLQDPIIPCT